jgi:cytochrome c oxidase assembly factor CtaG
VAGDLLQNWSADPAVLGTCVIAFALWFRGRRHLRARGDFAAAGSPQGLAWTDRPWYRPAFVAALVAMLAAACSPIDELSGELFWVHMVQHLILLMLVAPLLVLAAPWLPLWFGLPQKVRDAIGRRFGRILRNLSSRLQGRMWALVSLLLFVLGMWIWHWPRLYDLALSNDILHDYGEHNTFLVVGLLFWLQVLPSPPFRPALGLAGRALYLVAAILQNVLLSVVLGFAPHPLYAPYAALAHRPGGLSALSDQQLGAAIMWSIGDLPFVLGLMGLIQVWLRVQMASAGPDGSNLPAATPEGTV